MYELIFEKRALRDLNKLNKFVKRRIWKKLQVCKYEPFRYLERLVGLDAFKLRVGNYRIIIDIKERIRVLNILKIGHRKNIYKS